MDNFCVPPSPAWYTAPVCSPENGLLYIAGNHTTIAYIPPIQANSPRNVQIIQTHDNRFKSIICDTNWNTTKWFVTMNERNLIWVWNLEAEKICRGHKAHQMKHSDRPSNDGGGGGSDLSALGGAMCITRNRQILSIDRNAFVRYCLVSNTYSTFPDSFVMKRANVSLLKSSPHNQDIVAVGYRNGLIIIANYAETTVLQKLRGHDSEIVSLQWTLIEGTAPLSVSPLPPPLTSELQSETFEKVQPKPAIESCGTTLDVPITKKSFGKSGGERRQTRRDAPKPIVDAGDMFDIHSYDYLEEEFGTIASDGRTIEKESRDGETTTVSTSAAAHKPTHNENFNFIEECQTLRDQMSVNNQTDSDDSYGCSSSSVNPSIAVNMSDIQNMMKTHGAIKDDSIVLSDDSDGPVGIDEFSNRSTIGSSHNTTEIAELEDVIKDLTINDVTGAATMGTADDAKKSNSRVYLASGAQESCIVIWNTENGSIADKIQLKSQGRNKIPAPNCTIAWIRSNEFIVNGPDGQISAWKAQIDANSDEPKFSAVDSDYPDTAVINICSNIEYNPSVPIVYTSSTHLNIVGHRFDDDDDDESDIFSKYSTLPIGMFALRACPHDPNKIAIAGNNKRINILDLSTLKRDNLQIQALTSKIQGKVIALAWHPLNENLISFSTNEGRIGIFNISKNSSAPELIKNFNGKDLYSLSYGIDVDTQKCTLYAPSDHKLMMFTETATKDDKHQSMEFSDAISSVSVAPKFIAIGFSTGLLKILMNSPDKTEVFSKMISKKYLSEMSWNELNGKKLAVSSRDNHIYILNGDDGDTFQTVGELTGHQSGVTCVSWSSQTEHKLVSASFDHTVRVWDTQTMECIAWSEYDSKMQCAAFLPTDENFILCSGHAETMHIFDIRKRLIADIGPFDANKKKKTPTNDIQWGTPCHNDASTLRTKEKKKLRKLEKKSNEMVDEIADGLNAVTLVAPPIKLNHTTILYLTNKELNKEPLNHLQRLLTKSEHKNGDGDTGSHDEADGSFLHGKLFGDRETVAQLLNDELKNHQSSKTESIGHLLIPQINFELKANIIESIESKRLTEQQISLAPSISYEFWKNCCQAYASQCVEQGIILKAIPYMLVIQQINDAIEKLCDAHFYREAWCIAKMYKEPEDKLFETIVNKWIKHLEDTGNLEGAALISFLAGKQQMAHEILSKRKTKTPQIDEILTILS